ncbi:MAG: hypothetical protein ACRECQ_13450, partial [Burkholderiaceae bacterium]
VLGRYAARDIQLFRTDHFGALQWRFTADGRSTVIAARRAGARYWHNRPAPFAPGALDGQDATAPDTLPDASPEPPEPLFRN